MDNAFYESINDRLAEAEKAIKELQKNQANQAVDMGRFEVKLDHIKEAVDNLVIEIKGLSQLPAQRWNLIVSVAISVIVTAIVSAGISLVIIRTALER